MFHRLLSTVVVVLCLAGCDELIEGFGTSPADLPIDPGDPAVAARVRQQLQDAGIRPVPAAPQVSDALFDLGQALAFDKVLSGNRNISCLTCHHPMLGTDDDRPLPAGEGAIGLGELRTNDPMIPRTAPPLFNLHTSTTVLWDNRIRVGANGQLITPAGAALTDDMRQVLTFGPVAAQAMFPVLDRAEMRGQVGDNELANLDDDDLQGIWAALMYRLGTIPEYPVLFEAAYPGTDFDDMTFAHAANAIAGFEVTAFASRDSRFEQFMRGENTLTDDELDGADAFLRGGCARCHSGAGLSDQQPHNTGMPQVGPGKGDGASGREDFGSGAVDAGPRYGFRTPMLTNVAMTGPWGHAGQFNNLDTFVGHYRNPAGSLNAYDPRQHIDDSALWPLHFDGSDAQILATLDPRTAAMGGGPGGPGGPGGGLDTQAIVEFLNTLTAPSATDLDWTVPDHVPSGLVVD